MNKRLAIGICILALISAWVFWLTKPPPTQAQKMGAVIESVNCRQEVVDQKVQDKELQEYLTQLLQTISDQDHERFRQLTRLKRKSPQLAILQEILLDGQDFCPATILEVWRTRDTEEDLTLFPFDWRSSSLEPSVRIYSSSRHLVRIHSIPRHRDYHLVLYRTSEGFALLLAGEAK